jgi:PIN domain nuclease of toxin-antitoxin system
MKILLDTHIFLWLLFCPEKLSQTLVDAYQDKQNEIFLSHASLWEMQIKLQLGKLEFEIDLDSFVNEQVNSDYIKLLSIHVNHILFLKQLPFHHKDPFDRLLISQSIQEDFILASNDNVFKHYPVELFY